MATNLISFPFRLGPNGSVVTRPDDSSDYFAELIAHLTLTVPGERPQVPTFGLDDPTFGGVDVQDLVETIALFGPPVRIVSVRVQQVSATEQDVRVEFAPVEAVATAAARG